jgi:phosphatidylglycerol:prolipoprotein diacylglycerol transferase
MIDPIIFSVGPVSIRWYSIAYIAGIILSWFLILFLNKKEKLFDEKKIEDDFFTYSVIGIIIGGRLGYVLFYNFFYYIENPLDIIKVWNGGMSFHGGMIGGTIFAYLLAKKHKIKFIKLLDMISITVPIGLFFGRIANFINQELYGRVTTSRFGVIFDGQIEARHPSQLYEAFFEGFILFCFMFFLGKKTNSLKYEGRMSAIFLLGYGFFRFFIEFFREPDEQIGYIFTYFTMGQILCLCMIFIGIFLLFYSKKR